MQPDQRLKCKVAACIGTLSAQRPVLCAQSVSHGASLNEAPELQKLALNFLATFFSRHLGLFLLVTLALNFLTTFFSN